MEDIAGDGPDNEPRVLPPEEASREGAREGDEANTAGVNGVRGV